MTMTTKMNLADAGLYVLNNRKKKIFSDFWNEDCQKLYGGAKGSISSWRDSVKKMYDFLKTTNANEIKEKGKEFAEDVKKYFTKLPPHLKKVFSEFVDNFNKDINSLSTQKDKTIYCLKVFSCLASFLGGIYLGNNLPDKDIKLLGIGNHRNFIAHSFLFMALAKIIGIFLIRVMTEIENNTVDSDEYKKEFVLIKTLLNNTVNGAILGVATHLAVDGLVQSSGTIRFGGGINTLIPGTTIDDQAYLLVNAFMFKLFIV